ncbi:hypothetical protein ACVILI_006159 [Mesorhizobium sp. USDA 4775]
MSQFKVQLLMDTGTVRVRDVVCSGECRHRSDEECTSATHLVFAYRGVFVRHVGRNDAVAEANQLLRPRPTRSATLSKAAMPASTLSSRKATCGNWRRRSSCAPVVSWRFAASAGASIRARRPWWRCCATA